MDVKKLIEEVITDLANNKPINLISTKVQVISRLLKNPQFAQWVNYEFINGYENDSELPSYRKYFATGVRASYISSRIQCTNVLVPMENIGTERYLKMMGQENRQTVSLLQQALDSTGADICINLSPVEKTYVQEVLGYCQISEMHMIVSRQHFLNIIDKVKSQLINMFMDFNENLFENGLEFNPTTKKEEIQSIVHNYFAANINMGSGSIDAKESNNIGGQNNAVTISCEAKQQLNEIITQIESIMQEIDGDRTDIVDAILTMREELDSKMPRPKFLKTAFNGLKAIGTGIVVEKIIPLVDKGLALISNL